MKSGFSSSCPKPFYFEKRFYHFWRNLPTYFVRVLLTKISIRLVIACLQKNFPRADNFTSLFISLFFSCYFSLLLSLSFFSLSFSLSLSMPLYLILSRLSLFYCILLFIISLSFELSTFQSKHLLKVKLSSSYFCT
jgi:hypothetical protein